jgi:hypothetical protein
MFTLLKETITTQLNRRASSQKLSDDPLLRRQAREKGRGKIKERMSTLDLVSNVRTTIPSVPPPPYSVNPPPKRPLRRNNLTSTRPEDFAVQAMSDTRSSNVYTGGRTGSSNNPEANKAVRLSEQHLRSSAQEETVVPLRPSRTSRRISPEATSNQAYKAGNVLSVDNLKLLEGQIDEGMHTCSSQEHWTQGFHRPEDHSLKHMFSHDVKRESETTNANSRVASIAVTKTRLSNDLDRDTRHRSDPLPEQSLRNPAEDEGTSQLRRKQDSVDLEQGAQKMSGSIWAAYDNGKRPEIELHFKSEEIRHERTFKGNVSADEIKNRIIPDNSYYAAGSSKDFQPGGRFHNRSLPKTGSPMRTSPKGSQSFDNDLVVALRLQSKWDREDEEIREQREFAMSLQGGQDVTRANLDRLNAAHERRPPREIVIDTRERRDIVPKYPYKKHEAEERTASLADRHTRLRNAIENVDKKARDIQQRAVTLNRKGSYRIRMECVSCMEHKEKHLVAILECKHVYCGDCIAGNSPILELCPSP